MMNTSEDKEIQNGSIGEEDKPHRDTSAVSTHQKTDSVSIDATVSIDSTIIPSDNQSGDLNNINQHIGRSGIGETDDDAKPSETPQELTRQGLAFLEKDDFDSALNLLSWALELQLSHVDHNEYHPSLGAYYLNYGNALQRKEESSNELFSFTQQQQPHQSDASHESNDVNDAYAVAAAGDINSVRSNVTDEQLAWENLEMARLTMTRQLEALERQQQYTTSGVELCDSNEVPLTAVNDALAGEVLTSLDCRSRMPKDLILDLSFARIRLGDINILQERYEDAVEEFQAAVALREKYQLPYTMLQSPMISLAQAKQFALQPEEALIYYEKALVYVTNHIRGVGGFSLKSDLEKLKDYQLTAEDLSIQIQEIKTALADGTYEKAKEERRKQLEAKDDEVIPPVNNKSSSSSSNITNISQTENAIATEYETTCGFGKSILTDASVMNIGLISSARGTGLANEGTTTKRRRIAIPSVDTSPDKTSSNV